MKDYMYRHNMDTTRERKDALSKHSASLNEYNIIISISTILLLL